VAPRGLQTRPDPPFTLGCFPVEFLDILVKVHSLNITVHRSQSLTVVVASTVRIVSNRIMVRKRQYRYKLISGPARNLFPRLLQTPALGHTAICHVYKRIYPIQWKVHRIHNTLIFGTGVKFCICDSALAALAFALKYCDIMVLTLSDCWIVGR
jgi:hypothetical protein